MCGITGIVNLRGNVDGIAGHVKNMTDAIRHRGPDGEGFLFFNGTEDPQCQRRADESRGLRADAVVRYGDFPRLRRSAGFHPRRRATGCAWRQAAGHEGSFAGR